MATETPPNFVDLWTASTGTGSEVNIIGVVSDLMPAKKTAGTDWTCSFTLADRYHGGIGDIGNEGLKVRFFKKMQSELPVVWGTGDVMILRKMKINSFKGMKLAISTYGSTWTIIRASCIPDKVPSNAVQLPHTKDLRAPDLSLNEMKYAIDVCNHFEKGLYTSKIAPSATSPTPVSCAGSAPTQGPRQKFSLVKDVQIDNFYDLVGQVVKIFPSNGRTDLYITDYTPNQRLYFYQWGQDDDGMEARDGDEFSYVSRSSKATRKWPGPFGKLTLAVTLWSPHSEYAQMDLHEGDFVHLRNTHIRLDKDAKMNASLHSDRRYPDRIDVSILKDLDIDDRVKDVLRRKRDYHKKFDGEAEKYVIEVRDTKTDETRPLTKNQKRKKKRQEKVKAQLPESKPANQANTKRKRNDNDVENEPPDSSPPAKLPKRKDDTENGTPSSSLNSLKALKPAGPLNPNIHCSHHLIRPLPLPSILSLDKHINVTPSGTTYTLPFQNFNTRTTVRVIDFFPSNLADFSIPSRKRSEYAILSDHEEDSGSDGGGTTQPPTSSAGSQRESEDQKWEWRFALALEDASTPRPLGDRATMKACVVGADAECLLKLDAEDLRKSPTALATLREKLFLLWGDLEERKVRERDRKREEGNVLGKSSGNSRAPVADMKKGEKGGRPFQCCLKEYGVKVRTAREEIRSGVCVSDGDESEEGEKGWRWERRWRVFGCTIT